MVALQFANACRERLLHHLGCQQILFPAKREKEKRRKKPMHGCFLSHAVTTTMPEHDENVKITTRQIRTRRQTHRHTLGRYHVACRQPYSSNHVRPPVTSMCPLQPEKWSKSAEHEQALPDSFVVSSVMFCNRIPAVYCVTTFGITR